MESKAELLPELIFDILLRLPVKSLLRFMCVSKSWYSLITSPQFVKSHLKTCNTANRKLIFSSFLPIHSTDLFLTECDLNSTLHAPMTKATNLVCPNFVPMPQEKAVEIIGSCNGLVCLATDQQRTCLFIWNPSIRRYKKLPRWDDLELRASSLASYGFAYDELHDDYKVVAILVYRPNSDSDISVRCISVYSQKTNSWKKIKGSENSSVPRNWRFDVDRCGTSTNGRIHWIALLGPFRIVSFDLADETFGEIEHPPENIGEWENSIWAMGVLGEGYLALLWMPDRQKLDVDVWIMMEYGVAESWTKLYSIRYPYGAHDCLGHIGVQPLLVLKGGEFLFKLGSRLVIYNPEDDSCKDLNISHNLRQISLFLKVNVYDESLVLLDAHDG